MAKLVNKDGYKATIEFVISQDEFKKGIEIAYNKTKSRYAVPGFRKGKVPRKVIETNYGKGVFYEDALNELLPAAYEAAVAELDLDVVSRPDIDIKDFEDGKDIVIEAKVDLMPEIELPEYDGLDCTVEYPAFDEASVDGLLEAERQKNARLVPVDDKAAENGDTVIIDFNGKVDGVEFEGGAAKNHSLELGSNQFIPGFEDQVLGKKAGDEFDVEVTFPEEYHHADLAGKPAVFEVKLHEVKVTEIPELDDELIEEISEFDTVAEYREDLLKKTKEDWEKALEMTKKNAALKAISDIVVLDIPESMIELEVEQGIRDLDYRFRQQGFSLDTYFQMTQSTEEDLREQFKENAEETVKDKIVLNALLDKINPEVTDADIDEELELAAKDMNGDVEELRKIYSEDENRKALEEHIKTKKVFAEIASKMKFEVVEPTPEDAVNAEKVMDAVMDEVEEVEEQEEDKE